MFTHARIVGNEAARFAQVVPNVTHKAWPGTARLPQFATFPFLPEQGGRPYYQGKAL
jgi:hypothetical protein